ncbi:hypothetical protein TNCV_4977841 [Trichonephila clavipes]|nr:hypothetical protein TNCV_4977841 [Trichonephila clavipes]
MRESHYGATRGLLASELEILNLGQVMRITPELTTSFLTSTPYQREDGFKFLQSSPQDGYKYQCKKKRVWLCHGHCRVLYVNTSRNRTHIFHAAKIKSNPSQVQKQETERKNIPLFDKRSSHGSEDTSSQAAPYFNKTLLLVIRLALPGVEILGHTRRIV